MPATAGVELPIGDLRIVAALGDLPLAQRQVLVLHHLVDLPVGEVAATLRVPGRHRQVAAHPGPPEILARTNGVRIRDGAAATTAFISASASSRRS